MAKKDEALEIIAALGMPKAQQNDRSAWTILALLDINEGAAWRDAKQRNIRIHDIIVFIESHFGQRYAENSRETIRRQTIHQLEQASIVERNADDPSRSTNSPKTAYRISDAAYPVIKAFGTRSWPAAVTKFLKIQGALQERYAKTKKSRQVAVELPDGVTLALSPGKHNELQAHIINEFRTRFCAATTVVYVGDTAKKLLHRDDALLKSLNIPITRHDKLPDVVLYDRKANILFLVEAVTAHGPVSPKRQIELEKVLKKCPARRVFISAFLDFREFKRHMLDIAWDTEVWIYENPDHMVHFNGPKFFTYYSDRET